MGYKEAVEDNIRLRNNKYARVTEYYPNCTKCRKEVMTFSYVRGKKYTCKECKLENYLSDKDSRVEGNSDSKEKKFENAIYRIKNKTTRFERYNKAIESVHKYLHKDGWFDSTEEIMVAIELRKNNIKFDHQVKFGRYRVDFLLPDEKVVLEIDGTLFHTVKTREKELFRDNLITLDLGIEWEIIRITDEDINNNITRLMPAIKKIKAKRREVRDKNNGVLPDWYSSKSL